jgi:hypothetical protein
MGSTKALLELRRGMLPKSAAMGKMVSAFELQVRVRDWDIVSKEQFSEPGIQQKISEGLLSVARVIAEAMGVEKTHDILDTARVTPHCLTFMHDPAELDSLIAEIICHPKRDTG